MAGKGGDPEIYLQLPASAGQFFNMGPASPWRRLLGYGHDARALRDLHLQMVIYAKTEFTGGFVPDYMVWRLAWPDSKATATRSVRRLAAAGLVEAVEGGYQVPAAEEWPHLIQRGYRSPLRPAIRQRVLERDDYRCVKCGATEGLEIDHIIPWSKGGPDTDKNLQVLCAPCNGQKRARVA